MHVHVPIVLSRERAWVNPLYDTPTESDIYLILTAACHESICMFRRWIYPSLIYLQLWEGKRNNSNSILKTFLGRTIVCIESFCVKVSDNSLLFPPFDTSAGSPATTCEPGPSGVPCGTAGSVSSGPVFHDVCCWPRTPVGSKPAI